MGQGGLQMQGSFRAKCPHKAAQTAHGNGWQPIAGDACCGILTAVSSSKYAFMPLSRLATLV